MVTQEEKPDYSIECRTCHLEGTVNKSYIQSGEGYDHYVCYECGSEYDLEKVYSEQELRDGEIARQEYFKKTGVWV